MIVDDRKTGNRNQLQAKINCGYLTQQEVADRFRVAPSTIISWRGRGILRYFQAPGSRRVLYPVDAIEEFESKCIKQKGGNPNTFEIERKKPVVSSNMKEWRIP